MAIIWMEGFDHYAPIGGDGSLPIAKLPTTFLNSTVWSDPVSTGSDGTSISPMFARYPGQGQGLCMYNSGRWVVIGMPGAARATGVIGQAIRFNTTPSTAEVIAGFTDNDSQGQCDVRADGGGHLTVTREGTVLATSTNAVVVGVWYYIEFKATIHNTTGQYEVRVNGTSTGWIPQSTADKNTRAQTNNSYAGIKISSSNAFRDDMFVDDSTFHGSCRIVTAYPVAPGNYAQWTPNPGANFDNVADRMINKDVSFNQSLTAGHKDSFPLGDIPSGTILAVQQSVCARQDAGAQRSIRTLARIGGTDYVGTTTTLDFSYTFVKTLSVVSPATASAWTASEINGAEFGYEMVS